MKIERGKQPVIVPDSAKWRLFTRLVGDQSGRQLKRIAPGVVELEPADGAKFAGCSEGQRKERGVKRIVQKRSLDSETGCRFVAPTVIGHRRKAVVKVRNVVNPGFQGDVGIGNSGILDTCQRSQAKKRRSGNDSRYG